MRHAPLALILAGLLELLCPITTLADDPVTLVGQIPIPGAAFTTDVWGWVDPATDTEYAIVGNNNSGVHIVDVSDPASPFILSTVSGVAAFDVKVWDHYIYTCDGNFAMDGDIIDIADPANPQIVGVVPRCHNVAVDDRGFMYLEMPGLRIFRLLGNPTQPVMTFEALDDEGHDATIDGILLFDFHGADGTFIYNTFIPTLPLLLGSITDSSIAYHHSGATSEDRNYLFINDEFATDPSPDITVWDISTLATPVKVGSYGDNDATVHNSFRIGNYLYTAYYTAGFRVLDITTPALPTLAGSFDTSAADGETLTGAFGCYPFSPSGHIYVTDRPGGLFIFRFDPPATGISDARVPRFTLHDVFPNPGSLVTISYELHAEDRVTLEIYNARGQLVRSLVNNIEARGLRQVVWNARDDASVGVPSGVYFARLKSGGQTESKKVVLVR